MKHETWPAAASDFRDVAIVASVLIVLVACNYDKGGRALPDAAPPIDAATIDAATPPDATPAPDAGTPVPVTFRLAYEPAGPGPIAVAIYIDTGCGDPWLSVRDESDVEVRIFSDCGFCRCNDCEPCSVCDCAPLRQPIAAGGAYEYPWSGVTRPVIQSEDCGVCESTGVLAPGQYTARFCYTYDQNGPSSRCDETEFRYPTADGVVVYTVAM